MGCGIIEFNFYDICIYDRSGMFVSTTTTTIPHDFGNGRDDDNNNIRMRE
jgi:hypothetical protein